MYKELAIIYMYTIQLKDNVALTRYCLACFSKTIHSILDTRHRSLTVYQVLNHLNQPSDLSINNSLENYHS